MFAGLIEFGRGDHLSDHLDHLWQVDDEVIFTRSGGLMRAFRLEPPDLETADHDELIAHYARVTELLTTLGTGWSIWIDQMRREDHGYLPVADFGGDLAAARVDAARRHQFEHAPKAVFANTAYCAVHWAPQSRDAMLAFLQDRDVASPKTVYRTFLDSSDDFLRGLAALCPAVHRLRGPALARYLASTITYRDQPCLLPDAYLNSQLAAADWQTGTALQIDDLHVQTVEVHAFGAVSPLTFEELHELPFEARWTLTLHCLDPEDQRKALADLRNKWRPRQYGLGGWLTVIMTKNRSQAASNQAVEQVMADLDELEGSLAAERDGLAIATLSVRVWDRDPLVAEDNAKVVAGMLNALGMASRVATLNSALSTLADIPGNASRELVNRRRPYVRLGTAARCAPVTGLSTGDRDDRHLKGPALFAAQSRRRVPFYFALHGRGSDVGHTAVVGRTGSGKSALLSFMALQYLRYAGATVTIFDKRRSAMVATLCADDSRWIELGGGGIGVQPLRDLDDAVGMAAAQAWLQHALAMRQVHPSARVDAALVDALVALRGQPPDLRTLSALWSFLSEGEVRAALEHYTVRGPLGELFDGVVPSYGQARILTIETDDVMSLPEAPLALAACFQAIRRERLVGGHPKLVLIDEAWEPLGHPLFRDQIQDLARTMRKMNAQLGLFTQSLNDLQQAHTAVILQQISNLIFTPDPRATQEGNAALYQRIGLSEEQVRTVATMRPKAEYLVQTASYTRVADVLLEGDALAICGASRDGDIQRARRLLEAGVRPGREFTTQWLETTP